MTNKKKVLVITRNYPPLWGGMERLNLHMVSELSKNFRVNLIAPLGAEEYSVSNIKVTVVPVKPLSKFLVASCCRAILEAVIWKPDIILAGSGLTALPVWLSSKFCKARTVVYAHGLDMTVNHPIYRWFWYPILRRMDLLIANSNPTAILAKNCVGISKRKIELIHPGVELPRISTDIHGVRAKSKVRFCQKYGIEPGPLLLSVGRLTERKGLKQFVRDVLPLILIDCPSAKLVIIGDAPTDSLYAGVQTTESIMDAARDAKLEHCIYFLGKKFGGDLTESYLAADIHVFPIRMLPDDPEGFGMVAIEAAAHGLPTVAYACGGVVDAVCQEISGKLVPPGDSQSFAQAVLDLLRSPLPIENMYQFATSFSWDQFGKKLDRMLRGLF